MKKGYIVAHKLEKQSTRSWSDLFSPLQGQDLKSRTWHSVASLRYLECSPAPVMRDVTLLSMCYIGRGHNHSFSYNGIHGTPGYNASPILSLECSEANIHKPNLKEAIAFQGPFAVFACPVWSFTPIFFVQTVFA